MRKLYYAVDKLAMGHFFSKLPERVFENESRAKWACQYGYEYSIGYTINEDSLPPIAWEDEPVECYVHVKFQYTKEWLRKWAERNILDVSRYPLELMIGGCDPDDPILIFVHREEDKGEECSRFYCEKIDEVHKLGCSAVFVPESRRADWED